MGQNWFAADIRSESGGFYTGIKRVYISDIKFRQGYLSLHIYSIKRVNRFTSTAVGFSDCGPPIIKRPSARFAQWWRSDKSAGLGLAVSDSNGPQGLFPASTPKQSKAVRVNHLYIWA